MKPLINTQRKYKIFCITLYFFKLIIDIMSKKIGNENTILRFKPSQELLCNSNIAVIGNSKSGKTVLVRHILHFMKDIPMVGLICSGSKAALSYNTIIPQEQIFDGKKFKDSDLRKFIDSRDEATEEFVKNWSIVRKSLMFQASKGLIPYSESEIFNIITEKIIEHGTVKFCKSKREYDLIISIHKLLVRQEKTSTSSQISEDIKRRRISMFSDKRSMLIFDDMMGVSWFTDLRPSKNTPPNEINPIYSLLTRGRNAYITSFYILQSYKNSGLGSVARAAYHFIFIMGNLATYDAIRKDTIDGMIRTKSRSYIKLFHNLIKGILSQKGGAIVLVQDKPSIGIFDTLYFYKVSINNVIYPKPLMFNKSSEICKYLKISEQELNED